jgi:hypothetical protein
MDHVHDYVMSGPSGKGKLASEACDLQWPLALIENED